MESSIGKYTHDYEKELIEALINTDKNVALDILERYAQSETYYNTFRYLLNPALEKFGKLWYEGKISLAQGYVAGLIAEDIYILASNSPEFKRIQHDSNKVTVIGNAEEDYHSLGRKLISVFLKLDGWKVIDLGNDVSAYDFVENAVQSNASVIGVSAMMYTTAMNIKKIREELDSRGLSNKIYLAVGGAIFRLRPDLYIELGGNGTSDNAIDSIELFNKLHQKTLMHIKS